MHSIYFTIKFHFLIFKYEIFSWNKYTEHSNRLLDEKRERINSNEYATQWEFMFFFYRGTNKRSIGRMNRSLV